MAPRVEVPGDKMKTQKPKFENCRFSPESHCKENLPSSKADLCCLLGASPSHCQWSFPYSSSRVPRLVARAQVHLDGDVRRMTKTFPMAMAMAIMKQRRKFSQVNQRHICDSFTSPEVLKKQVLHWNGFVEAARSYFKYDPFLNSTIF